jgi:hypothetical protein
MGTTSATVPRDLSARRMLPYAGGAEGSVRVARDATHRHDGGGSMDDESRVAVEAWARSQFAPDDLATLRALIATFEQRLRDMDPEARTQAVVDAIVAAATHDPGLTAAFARPARTSTARRQRNARLN